MVRVDAEAIALATVSWVAPPPSQARKSLDPVGGWIVFSDLQYPASTAARRSAPARPAASWSAMITTSAIWFAVTYSMMTFVPPVQLGRPMAAKPRCSAAAVSVGPSQISNESLALWIHQDEQVVRIPQARRCQNYFRSLTQRLQHLPVKRLFGASRIPLHDCSEIVLHCSLLILSSL